MSSPSPAGPALRSFFKNMPGTTLATELYYVGAAMTGEIGAILLYEGGQNSAAQHKATYDAAQAKVGHLEHQNRAIVTFQKRNGVSKEYSGKLATNEQAIKSLVAHEPHQTVKDALFNDGGATIFPLVGVVAGFSLAYGAKRIAQAGLSHIRSITLLGE
jgi:NADH/NAD ratio-sensing transcriptional regulator Rex